MSLSSVEYRALYYQRNKERIKAASRRYYATHKDERKEKDRKYSQKHAERIRRYQKQYRVALAHELAQKLKARRQSKPAWFMLLRARRVAKQKGIPFDLVPEDIVVPERCPVLNIPMRVGTGKRTDASPSLDRIIPELGYVKGNVKVISWRANNLKSDATAQELRAVLDYLEREQNGKH